MLGVNLMKIRSNFVRRWRLMELGGRNVQERPVGSSMEMPILGRAYLCFNVKLSMFMFQCSVKHILCFMLSCNQQQISFKPTRSKCKFAHTTDRGFVFLLPNKKVCSSYISLGYLLKSIVPCFPNRLNLEQ